MLRIAMINTVKLLVVVSLTGAGIHMTGAGQLIMSGQGEVKTHKVTDVDYISDTADARMLSAVMLKVLPAPAKDTDVKIRLQPKGAWYDCSSEGTKVECPTVSTPIMLEEVVEIQVVAS